MSDINELVTDASPIETSSSGSAAPEVDNNVFDRLSDPSKFVGTARYQFNEEGVGLGRAGREDAKKNDGYVQGFTPDPLPDLKTDIPAETKNPAVYNRLYADAQKKSPRNPTSPRADQTTATKSLRKDSTGSNSKTAAPSVFDRLTNSNKYTGTQKTRHEEIKSPRSNTGSTKTEDTAKSPRADATKSPRPAEKGDSVFTRLSDPSKYTEARKQNINANK